MCGHKEGESDIWEHSSYSHSSIYDSPASNMRTDGNILVWIPITKLQNMDIFFKHLDLVAIFIVVQQAQPSSVKVQNSSA